MQQHVDILLGLGVVISLCLIAITIFLAIAALELRTTLRQFNRLLPGIDRIGRDVRRAFRQVGRILLAARRATGRVDAVIDQACGTAEEALARVQGLAAQARAFWGHQTNGAGAGPRRVRRSGNGNRRRGVG